MRHENNDVLSGLWFGVGMKLLALCLEIYSLQDYVTYYDGMHLLAQTFSCPRRNSSR